jgi:small subunit ribosomal protein S5
MAKNQRRQFTKKEKPEFEQKMIDLARVTRVTGGGKRMSFRALVVIGDKKGRVGYGIGKGKDVTMAVTKAVDKAKKNIIRVSVNKNGTILYEVRNKFKSSYVMIKPAPKGTGVKAGGPVRIILDMAGIENIVGKMLGKSTNKINMTISTYEALKQLPNIAPKVEEKKEKVEKAEEK